MLSGLAVVILKVRNTRGPGNFEQNNRKIKTTQPHNNTLDLDLVWIS